MAMRATKVFLGSAALIFGVLFAGTLVKAHSDGEGRIALGFFLLFGAGAATYLLSKGRTDASTTFDLTICAATVLAASWTEDSVLSKFADDGASPSR